MAIESKQEHSPYLDQEGKEVDFMKKRLKFWQENVSVDLRRLEYDLWKGYRRSFHGNLHAREKIKYVGRFKVAPPFTKEDDEKYWREFQESFLSGKERLERFLSIVNQVKKDLPGILRDHAEKIPKGRVRLVALAGSAFYGPRQEGKILSDIDLNFLFDTDSDELNFEILPSDGLPSDAMAYHLRGTGWSDRARGSRDLIHWLLFPHFPIQNKLADPELKRLLRNLTASTKDRTAEIQQAVVSLQESIISDDDIIIG